jgi:hypothetical protein
MVVVDLSLPVEPKLTLVKEVSYYQPDAQIMTIGKVEYIKDIGVLSSLLSIASIDSIEIFPNTLRDYITGISTTPTNSVYGAMQDGYVEWFDHKISPRPSFPKRGITISPFGKGGIRGIL